MSGDATRRLRLSCVCHLRAVATHQGGCKDGFARDVCVGTESSAVEDGAIANGKSGIYGAHGVGGMGNVVRHTSTSRSRALKSCLDGQNLGGERDAGPSSSEARGSSDAESDSRKHCRERLMKTLCVFAAIGCCGFRSVMISLVSKFLFSPNQSER